MNDFVWDQYLSHRVKLASMFSMDMIMPPKPAKLSMSIFRICSTTSGTRTNFILPCLSSPEIISGKEKGDTNPGSPRY